MPSAASARSASSTPGERPPPADEIATSSSLPESSSTMRSAVFFPTPETAVSAAALRSRTARASDSTLIAESTASASRGPTPLMASSRVNTVFSVSSRNPKSITASSRTRWKVRSVTCSPSRGSRSKTVVGMAIS